MTDLHARLVSCFASVFPDLDADAVPAASTRSVATWDSLATVNLVTLIEEEFGVSIPADDLPALTSFEHTLRWLRRAAGNAA
jgi:acyl carrier protein